MEKQNNTQANVSQTLIGANDKGRVTYQVNGEDVNLSFQIVRSFLTRGSAAVTDAELAPVRIGTKVYYRRGDISRLVDGKQEKTH